MKIVMDMQEKTILFELNAWVNWLKASKEQQTFFFEKIHLKNGTTRNVSLKRNIFLINLEN